ncbi:uncharacterized protein MEPE_03999 [Melanopsichium pennsylvanicum]|uniref:Uncharacterized protein n=1 Tax=Melanopsichium pennsylvanicum TaxID=63383 RepID=A0AAJ5C600_9BASI|nr:uncharacterized protein MEPE_03999 [Melanopsichium pennsylvanicum]
MSSTSNTTPSAASLQPASTQMPALRAEEPVRRSARLRERNPAARAVATPSAVGLEATATSSSAAGEQPLEIVAAEQLVALRSTPRPLEPLFLGNDATGEEEERLEAMEVEESVVGRVSEAGEDPVALLVGPRVPNHLEIALWAESFIAPVLLVFVACFASAFADVLSAGGKGRTLRACVHCHLGGHKKCVRTVRALPTTVYAGDAPPRHLHRGERGVERAHVTRAGGRGLGESASPGADDDRGVLRSSAARAVYALAIRGSRAFFGAWAFVSPRVGGVVRRL